MRRKLQTHNKTKKLITLGLAMLLVIGALPDAAAVADNRNTEISMEDIEQPTDDYIDDNEITPVIANRITKEKFKTQNVIHTENSAFIVNMTTGELLAIANQDQVINAYDVLKPMVTQVFLSKDNLDDVVEVQAKSLKKVKDSTIVFGLKSGDRITVRDLLSIYLLTDAADAYRVLVDYVSSSDLDFLTILNKTAQKLSLTGTSFSNIQASSQAFQYSDLYDAYDLYFNLMQNDWFMETISSKKINITYNNSKNKTISQTVDNLNSSMCGEVVVGNGYKFFAQLSMCGDNDRDGQFVIFTDTYGQYYLSYLGNVNDLRRISSESGRLIRTLSGYEFTDAQIVATPSPTPTPTPKPTATPTPSPTPKPTATPTPSPTPIVSKSGLPIESNNARYQYIMGTNYKAYTMRNRPVGFKTAAEASKKMTTFTVPVWKMNSKGQKYSSKMTITIHKKLANSVKQIFNEIYELDIKFPIKNLLGYGYREVGGVGLKNIDLMSIHAFGCAIDINSGNYDNDYYLGKGNDLRDKNNPYCIPDEVIDIFESHGWFWGGDFEICSDTMHFQYLGLEFLTYQGKDVFRKLSYKSDSLMSGADVKNLQQRLTKLGFKVSATGQYNKASKDAVKKFQKAYGLSVTGVVNYKTWETLINATHDMSYVF